MNFICKGRITLDGVLFFIEAENIEEAQKKADKGEYEDYDARGAETVDWYMRAVTVEPNE